MNPCMNARGLLLASASTRYPRGGYRFGFNDRNIILGANSQDRGHHDKVPVLAQHGFEATSEFIRGLILSFFQGILEGEEESST
jgi:hypothetical protein